MPLIFLHLLFFSLSACFNLIILSLVTDLNLKRIIDSKTETMYS